MEIGAIAESFNKLFRETIESIATLKLDDVQMYADTETVHAGMTAKDIKEVRRRGDKGFGAVRGFRVRYAIYTIRATERR